MRGEPREVRVAMVDRYGWAAARLKGSAHVIDAGCNCGYGAAILADAGLTVTALDLWFQGLEYARKHYDRTSITWAKADFEAESELPPADAVVALEVIEHLADPRPLLREARRVAGQLLASVPDEDVWPHEARLYPEHQRHYTPAQIEALLVECGWSEIKLEQRGRSIMVECR